jgi:hypothetical protein
VSYHKNPGFTPCQSEACSIYPAKLLFQTLIADI